MHRYMITHIVDKNVYFITDTKDDKTYIITSREFDEVHKFLKYKRMTDIGGDSQYTDTVYEDLNAISNNVVRKEKVANYHLYNAKDYTAFYISYSRNVFIHTKEIGVNLTALLSDITINTQRKYLNFAYLELLDSNSRVIFKNVEEIDTLDVKLSNPPNTKGNLKEDTVSFINSPNLEIHSIIPTMVSFDESIERCVLTSSFIKGIRNSVINTPTIDIGPNVVDMVLYIVLDKHINKEDPEGKITVDLRGIKISGNFKGIKVHDYKKCEVTLLVDSESKCFTNTSSKKGSKIIVETR